ncbi:MAG: glutamine amidotransferase, partial [Eubacterium sp.]|nr:glutamine amidotransferase [Eubacterium sp.]
GTEGVRYKNTFGTYSHGPVLPKNSQLADLLISKAVENKYGKTDLAPLDDTLEIKAQQQVMKLYIR